MNCAFNFILVRQHGGVVVRNAGIDVTEFYALVESISPGIKRGVGDEEQNLHLHGELYYLPAKLDLLWFYCVVPPHDRGQTILCDGVAVARQLKPSTRFFFEATPLEYKFDSPRRVWAELFGDLPIEQAAATANATMGAVATNWATALSSAGSRYRTMCCAVSLDGARW